MCKVGILLKIYKNINLNPNIYIKLYYRKVIYSYFCEVLLCNKNKIGEYF